MYRTNEQRAQDYAQQTQDEAQSDREAEMYDPALDQGHKLSVVFCDCHMKPWNLVGDYDPNATHYYAERNGVQVKLPCKVAFTCFNPLPYIVQEVKTNPLLDYLESKIPEHLWGDYVIYLSNPGYSLESMWEDEGAAKLGAAIDHYCQNIIG